MIAAYLAVATVGSIVAILVRRELPALATPLAIVALAGSCLCLLLPLRGRRRHQYMLWFMLALGCFAFCVPIAASAGWVWAPCAVYGALCVTVLCLYLRYRLGISSRYRRLRQSDKAR